MLHTVVIAGGGPTGLMLACELRLAGVPTVVLEPRTEQPEWSQGMAVHGRTLRLFDQRGLRERIDPAHTFFWPRTPFAMLWLDLETVGEEDHTISYPQWRTERLLASRAEELGADVRRGHRLVGLTQDDDGVTVRVEADGGGYELAAAYLVGADGGQSAVRALADIPASVGARPYSGILADVTLPEGVEQPFNAGVHPSGMFGALPIQAGSLRLMTIEFDTDPPTDDAVDEADLLASIRRVADQDVLIDRTIAMSRFGGRTVLAERYRSGRVLLAGDAAHHYFISGTQGMNCGIQDAANLGWKLAAAVAGWAPEGLLDTYDEERRPVGRRMATHADAVMALVHPLDNVRALRELIGRLLQFESVNRHLLSVPTEADYHREDDAHPWTGRRAPEAVLRLDEVAAAQLAGRGALVEVGPASSPAGPPPGDRLAHVALAAADAEAAGITEAAVVLVRPDGYVAFADRDGTDVAGRDAALAAWFGVALTPA